MPYLTLLVLALVFCVPLTSSAATAAELQAQAQALLAQVQALQAQLTAQGGPTIVPATLVPNTPAAATSGMSCPLIVRILSIGDSGEDVARLQQFLARDASVYPEALVTGYYGALTEAAVKRWQAKHSIVSSGDPASTGYGQVGPRTAAAMSLQCSAGNVPGAPSVPGAPAPVPTAPEVIGGFIQVTPVSGNAPLNVKVTVTANTTKSCSGAVFNLDWGDGSSVPQIVVPPNKCDIVVANYAHLYLYGGTYVIRLSSGGHSTSATVLVSGAGAPTAVSQQDSFNASPTSGTAPLEVTFSGTVTGANKGWCASGCTSALDFGDGTFGSVSLPLASNGVQQYSLKHTYAKGGTYTAKLHQGSSSSNTLVGSPITITVQSNVQDFSYAPPAITPNVNGDPLVVRVAFNAPTACTGYSVAWGDGSTNTTQAHTTSCAQTEATHTLTHTYAGPGSYTITLRRGPELTRQDSVSLVISSQ